MFYLLLSYTKSYGELGNGENETPIPRPTVNWEMGKMRLSDLYEVTQLVNDV